MTSTETTNSYNQSFPKYRTNEGFKTLQTIDIWDKYLVYGFLRKQQVKLFENTYHKNNIHFNLHAVVTVILRYFGEADCKFKIFNDLIKCKSFNRCIEIMRRCRCEDIEKYLRMIKINISVNVVENKMKQDGNSDKINLLRALNPSLYSDYKSHAGKDKFVTATESSWFTHDANHIKQHHSDLMQEYQQYTAKKVFQNLMQETLPGTVKKYAKLYKFRLPVAAIRHQMKKHGHTDNVLYKRLMYIHKKCLNDNCFYLKHIYLHNKDHHKNTNDLLERLINLHLFIFHSKFISELHVVQEDVYVVINYFESQQRHLNIERYEKYMKNDYENVNDVIVEIIHLISFYYGGKFIGNNVSALDLAKFTKHSMKETILDRIWERVMKYRVNIISNDVLNIIDAVDDILLFIAVAHKNGSLWASEMTRSKLTSVTNPIGEWIKTEKMTEQSVITKQEFRDTFSKWLKEYDTRNDTTVQRLQRQLLRKYKVLTQKYNSDRLIIYCEHLSEQNE
eukprot:120772_1